METHYEALSSKMSPRSFKDNDQKRASFGKINDICRKDDATVDKTKKSNQRINCNNLNSIYDVDSQTHFNSL